MFLKFLFILVANLSVFANGQREPYRLQDYVIPERYDLWLKIDVDNFVFSGTLKIEITITEQTRSFFIHVKDTPVSFRETTLSNASSTFELYDWTLRPEEEMYEVVFNEDIEPGQYVLGFAWNGNIGTELKGLYRSSYADGKYIATTHMEPTYARMVFPCFDEPRFKSIFHINIYHPPMYRVNSNMPAYRIVENIVEQDGYTLTSFEETPVPIPTYLVAFVVHQFDFDITPDYEFSVYVPPGQLESARDALAFAPRAMTALEEYVGFPYQLPKTDFIAIPDFEMGAMENWGLITFRAIYLLYPDQTTPARIHQTGRLLISHELAHMWFGNELTPDWWSYVWLSEGFARFLEYYITDQLSPDWRIWDQFSVNNLQSALGQDAVSTARRMSEPVVEPSIIQQLFDYIVYAKSGSVIRMWYEFFGSEIFQKSLQEYIRINSHATVQPSDLFTAFQTVVNANSPSGGALPYSIEEFFSSWADNEGYPVIFATVDEDIHVVHITQKRFYLDPVEMAESVMGDYIIPISIDVGLRGSEAIENYQWLSPNEVFTQFAFDSQREFVLLNKNQVGFYRVQYNIEHWNKLIKILNSTDTYGKFYEANRAQLIDDSVSLARADLLDFSIAFDVLFYLQHDASFVPWMSANNALNFLVRIMRGSSEYLRFENFVHIITTRVFRESFQSSLNVDLGNHVGRIHRLNTVPWACYSGHEDCVKGANQLVRNFIDYNEEILEELEPMVYCTIGKHIGDGKLITDLISRVVILMSTDRDAYLTKLYTIITGIGCTTSKTYIDQVLDLSQFTTGGYIQGKDRSHMLVSLVNGSYEGAEAVLRVLFELYTTYTVLMSDSEIVSVVDAVGPRIVTQHLQTLLNNFVEQHSNNFTPAIRAAVTKAVAAGVENLRLRSIYMPSIDKWLQEHVLPIAEDSGSSIIKLSLTLIVCAFAVVVKNFIE